LVIDSGLLFSVYMGMKYCTIVRPEYEKGMEGMVAEEPQSPPTGFPFNELIEDCADVILTNYLDLPTLLSYGYTSKAAKSRVKKALERREDEFERFLCCMATLGYTELLRFFIIETPPFRVTGQTDHMEMWQMISTAVECGHVELVRSLMRIRNGVFVGFFGGVRLNLPTRCHNFDSTLESALVWSNSPSMYNLFVEVKVRLDDKNICRLCVHCHKFELLRYVFLRLDAVDAFDLLCDLIQKAISRGAIEILDGFIQEMKMIQVEGNEFVVAFGGQYRRVPFEVAWLRENLLEVATWLDRLGIQITFSHCIGYHMLCDSNPCFLAYLEQKGIDYRDLVGVDDFKKLFYCPTVESDHDGQSVFYDKVFRDRRILEMLTSQLTSLIRFIGLLARGDPMVFLPLVRWIYDEVPLRHTLPHPFQLISIRKTRSAKQMLRFLLDFSWTSQIDPYTFFGTIHDLEPLTSSEYRHFIIEFIAMKRRRDDSGGLHFRRGILPNLLFTRGITLKDLHEILLVMPPLRSDFAFDPLSTFLDLHCQSEREHDSFVAIMEWIKSHDLGDEMASWSDEVAIKYITMCHEKVLPYLFDNGLPMPSKSSLTVLSATKVKVDGWFPYRTEKTMKDELTALGRTLEKLRVLKRRGAHFAPSLLRDAFYFSKVRFDERAFGFASLFRHSEEVKNIFDFLIDDCACTLHANVLLAAIRMVGKETICRAGTIRTLEHLINRQCPYTNECMDTAISFDRSHGDSFLVDLLTSKDRRSRRAWRL